MTAAAPELTTAAPREADSGRLRLDALTKRFTGRSGTVTAVDSVSLDVEPGEFTVPLRTPGNGQEAVSARSDTASALPLHQRQGRWVRRVPEARRGA